MCAGCQATVETREIDDYLQAKLPAVDQGVGQTCAATRVGQQVGSLNPAAAFDVAAADRGRLGGVALQAEPRLGHIAASSGGAVAQSDQIERPAALEAGGGRRREC